MSEPANTSVRELDRKFVGGLAWTAGGKWSTQLITWASVVALARILSPAELGLAGMAGLFHVLTTTLAEFGLASAIVQMRNLQDEVIAQLHSASVAICALFYLFALAASPWIASFFSAEEVRWLVVANSTAILMTGFQSVPKALLRRALDYRRLALADGADFIVRAIVSVLAALLGASYWSPLIGGLTAKLVATILVLKWAPFRFQSPQWHTIREPLLFGWRVSVASFSNTLTTQADPLIVAKRLGEDALGVYRFAIDIANAPADKINSLVMRVSGPLIASIQGDMELVRRYFRKLAEPLTMSIFPAVVGFSLVAPDLILALVGEKWREAIAPVQLLTLCAGIRALNSLNRQVLISLHDTKFVMYVSAIKFAIMPLIFYYISPYGIIFVAAVWLLAVPLEFIIFTARMIRRISLPVAEFTGAFAPAIVGSAFMGTALLLAQAYGVFAFEPRLLRIIAQIALGCACYGAILLLFFRKRLLRYLTFMKTLRGGKAKLQDST